MSFASIPRDDETRTRLSVYGKSLVAGLVGVAARGDCVAVPVQRLDVVRTDVAGGQHPLQAQGEGITLPRVDAAGGYAVQRVLQALKDTKQGDVAQGVGGTQLPGGIRAAVGTGRVTRTEEANQTHLVAAATVGAPHLQRNGRADVLTADLPHPGVQSTVRTAFVQADRDAKGEAAEVGAVVPYGVAVTTIPAVASRMVDATGIVRKHRAARRAEHLQVARQTVSAVDRVDRVKIALVDVFIRAVPDAAPALTDQADVAVTIGQRAAGVVLRQLHLEGEVELQATAQIFDGRDGDVRVVGRQAEVAGAAAAQRAIIAVDIFDAHVDRAADGHVSECSRRRERRRNGCRHHCFLNTHVSLLLIVWNTQTSSSGSLLAF